MKTEPLPMPMPGWVMVCGWRVENEPFCAGNVVAVNPPDTADLFAGGTVVWWDRADALVTAGGYLFVRLADLIAYQQVK